MMTADLPLFAVPALPPMHRATDPDTSRDAARRVARRLGPLHQQVMAAVAAAGPLGATGRELEQLPQFADCAPSTVRKRASECHQLGQLVAAGRRDGMTVYRLAEEAAR